MKKVLVTGGAGFVGSALCKKLHEDGFKVFIVDNLSTGYKKNIIKGANFTKLDVGTTEFDDYLNVNNNFNIIYHIAAQSSGEISFENPEYDLKTNTLSTLKILNYCKRNNVPLIFASSMSVYGAQNPGSELSVAEDAHTNPLSFYAVGKKASEDYISIYSKIYSIKAISLRFFNIYGPGQNLENVKQGMVSIFLAQSLRSNKIEIKGSLNRYRDQVYIDDVISALIASSKAIKEIKEHEIINISTNLKTKITDILDILKREVNNDLNIIELDGTPGDQFGITGSNEKANKILNWKPKTDFDSGLTKMIHWARSSKQND